MKKIFNRIFIDGLGGMALGLFSTLIIGTIICQIGKLFGDTIVATYLIAIGNATKSVTGAGIGVGVAVFLFFFAAAARSQCKARNSQKNSKHKCENTLCHFGFLQI